MRGAKGGWLGGGVRTSWVVAAVGVCRLSIGNFAECAGVGMALDKRFNMSNRHVSIYSFTHGRIR